MDKKSIIGIAVVAVLFLGFAYFNSQQQKEYLEQKAAYEAYVDSVAAAARAAAPVADSLASGNGVQAEVAAAEAAAAVRERQVETLGESLTAAREAEAEEFIVPVPGGGPALWAPPRSRWNPAPCGQSAP